MLARVKAQHAELEPLQQGELQDRARGVAHHGAGVLEVHCAGREGTKDHIVARPVDILRLAMGSGRARQVTVPCGTVGQRSTPWMQ